MVIPTPSRLRITPHARASGTSDVDNVPTGVGIDLPLTVQAHGTTVTRAMREYGEQKVAPTVARYAVEVKSVDVHLATHAKAQGIHSAKAHEAEIVVHTFRNGTVRVAAEAPDMYQAMDAATHKLKKALQKTKEKAALRGTWPGHQQAGRHAEGHLGAVSFLTEDGRMSIDASEDEDLV